MIVPKIPLKGSLEQCILSVLTLKIIWGDAKTMKKQINNPQQYDIVEVCWHDSAGPPTAGWCHIGKEDLDEDYNVMCYTSGYLIRESDSEIWIVHSYHENSDNISALGMVAIPKVALTARKLIKKGKVKR